MREGLRPLTLCSPSTLLHALQGTYCLRYLCLWAQTWFTPCLEVFAAGPLMPLCHGASLFLPQGAVMYLLLISSRATTCFCSSRSTGDLTVELNQDPGVWCFWTKNIKQTWNSKLSRGTCLPAQGCAWWENLSTPSAQPWGRDQVLKPHHLHQSPAIHDTHS